MVSLPNFNQLFLLKFWFKFSDVEYLEAIAHNQDSKLAVTFTPGINKRRLKRETNLVIGKIGKRAFLFIKKLINPNH